MGQKMQTHIHLYHGRTGPTHGPEPILTVLPDATKIERRIFSLDWSNLVQNKVKNIEKKKKRKVIPCPS